MFNSPWMKSALVILVLLQLGQGQQVFADTAPADTQISADTTQTTTTTDAATTATTPPTVQDVLLAVCTARGYGVDCAKTLLGMLWKESNNISTAIGDHGLAAGYFQIHYKMHKISKDCAEEIVCSANWTLNYLELHSYPKYVNYAVQCHNSCNVNNGYAASALRFGKRFWNTPLTITQAAPVDTSTLLALK